MPGYVGDAHHGGDDAGQGDDAKETHGAAVKDAAADDHHKEVAGGEHGNGHSADGPVAAPGGEDHGTAEAHGNPDDGHHAIPTGRPPPNTGMFFTIYFAMTGLYGIHVIVGIGIFFWLLIRAMKGHFNEEYFGPIDFAALYWHLVDLIWIYLFPLLYLIH